MVTLMLSLKETVE